GFSYGTRKQTDWIDGEKVFNTASTVGSVEGDALIKAGKALNITGSNVLARQGDITLIGQEVNIGAALDTAQEKEFHEIKQTGLTLTASNPIVSAVQTGIRMAEAAGKTDNTVMKGLAGATAGVAAVNAYDAVRASAKAAEAAELAKAGSSNKIDQVGGVSIKLSLGTSKNSSTTDRSSSSAHGSTITAGRDLTVVAQGAGKDSDITVTGSNLSAGDKVALKAEGDVILQAARNAFEQQTDSKSSSASIGIGYSTGGKQNGFTLELGASLGRGKTNGKDESWTNSLITAGNVLAIQSGGDTTLKGATGEAERIIASVGGNLLLESLQDSSKYDTKNQSAGFGLSLCIPPYCQGASSFSANASAGKLQSDFKSVMEQTGLRAGDGGFQIDVKNETKLVGSVLASSDRAVGQGLNTLHTGTLITEDIKNRAKYSGGQVSIGGGFGFGFGGGKGADAGLGTTKGGQVAGGASKEHGSSVATGSSGFGMGTPIVVGAKGSSSSTTQSAISGGTVVIRDEAAQQDRTGMTAAETIAALNRDASDTLNALKPIFDKDKIEAGFEIASEAQRQAGQFLENRAKEADALKKAMDAEPEGARKEQLAAQYAEAAKWGPNGGYRLLITAVSAAAGGNVTGGAGQFAQSAAVNYLHSMGAAQIKDLAASLGGEGSPGHVALHAVLACGGAVVQGANCGAGAVGASASIVLNSLLEKAFGPSAAGLRAEEKEQRSNLIVSIVAAISSGLSSEQMLASATAARIEVENNTLKDHASVHTAKFESKVKELAECVGDRGCQSAVGHFDGWIKVIDEQDLPACGYNDPCVQDKLLEREIYVAGRATAIGRLSDPLIAGMDLLDTANRDNTYDRLALKDALVRFQIGTPDYANGVDRFVVETMMASPVVFAAVKGLSPLDSDGGGSGKPKSSSTTLENGSLPKIGSLKGDPELPPKNASPDMVRSIERQNEAAIDLAKAGYQVEQLPNINKNSANPDLKINGEFADVYSPKTNSLISVLKTMAEKVDRQARNIVVNLADSPLTFSQIEGALKATPVEGLRSVYVLKGGKLKIIEVSK
ncbi:hemagglutinin repeat-containing protein, partial [Achromobacter insolitus]|uniref:hemagglutinin repeat-containing protein n=1 Tax=Achromobacter insolitus TaxID=217204 RepID=UPI001581A552